MDPNLTTGIIGKSIAEVQNIDWYQNWNQANLMFVSDFNGNGTLELNEFFMGGKAVVLATPEIAGLPYVISGLVAAGGMAAAMSTADGLVLAIANALSHDLYYKIIDPKAETAKRLIVEARRQSPHGLLSQAPVRLGASRPRRPAVSEGAGRHLPDG